MLDSFINSFRLWKDIKIKNSEDDLKRSAAIGCVKDAVLATKAYLYDKELGQESRETERLLSEKWKSAADAIREFDFELFRSAEIKAFGWADPREWVRAKDRKFAVALNTILEQCEYLEDKSRHDWR